MVRRWAALWLIAGLVLLPAALPVLAQSRSVYWDRWDVVIDQVDTAANRFRVTESYRVTFTGSFTFGSVEIPTERLDRIENITITHNGQALRASCSGSAGTYCVTYTGDTLNIVYYFTAPVRNSTEKLEITYDVVGAIRVYEDGDQLWWNAIPAEHFGFPIGGSTVTVLLPEGFAPREGIDPVVTYGAAADVQVNGTTVVANATSGVGGDEELSIRVQFPHNPAASPPAWQAAFDSQRAFEENVLPFITIGVLAASVLIALGGTLFVFIRYRTHGRDPEVGPVPEFLSEPPDDTPPAVVGALVDEKVDLRDIISTLIDLARRGYIVFEEEKTEGFFGIGAGSEFTFKRTGKPADDLRPYETRFLNDVFPGGSLVRTMNSMRNTFYTSIPHLQSAVYDEMVSRRFFERSPETTRQIWGGFGGLLLAVGIIGGLLLLMVIEASGIWLCLPMAIGLVGLVMIVVAPGMPVKTAAGAESSAKWKAFEQYLRNLSAYGANEQAGQRFDQYLAYAVAFGIERSFIRQFEQTPNAVMWPPWYIPRYRGGIWSGGYTPGTAPPTGGLPGDLARAGGSGSLLDDLSGGLTGGLENISDGLTSMLNNASSVMNSRPSAQAGSSGSWRSGGGGWSGGGFSGGGGGGGGSRGFG